jgi:hypothetical protein
MLSIIGKVLFGNGGFEAGNASGWILTDIDSDPSPIAVRGPGYNSGFGFFSSAPTDGNFCLTHGFDGNGPGRIRAAFDVALPPSVITLTFKYRIAWDMQNYPGSTQSRKFVVTIEPSGGGQGLQTNVVFTAAPGTESYDTGNLSGLIDLSAFANRSVRISFDVLVPESLTGPGFFQLDNVVLSYAPNPPLQISRSGTNVVLSWPATFSNFTAVAGGSFNSIGTWTPLATNLILRGATNAAITVPSNATNRYYRLKSF